MIKPQPCAAAIRYSGHAARVIIPVKKQHAGNSAGERRRALARIDLHRFAGRHGAEHELQVADGERHIAEAAQNHAKRQNGYRSGDHPAQRRVLQAHAARQPAVRFVSVRFIRFILSV